MTPPGRGDTRPLAAAAARLRGKPGRPRKGGAPARQATTPPAGPPLTGPSGGRGPVVGPEPRLLDLAGTARYLTVSTWTIRDLEAAGILRRVRVPLPNNGELRKLLFDRQDLDRLVEKWKERP